jgi:hypothetical protein
MLPVSFSKSLFQSTPESLERVVACERINNTIKKTEEV